MFPFSQKPQRFIATFSPVEENFVSDEPFNGQGSSQAYSKGHDHSAYTEDSDTDAPCIEGETIESYRLAQNLLTHLKDSIADSQCLVEKFSPEDLLEQCKVALRFSLASKILTKELWTRVYLLDPAKRAINQIFSRDGITVALEGMTLRRGTAVIGILYKNAHFYPINLASQSASNRWDNLESDYIGPKKIGAFSSSRAYMVVHNVQTAFELEFILGELSGKRRVLAARFSVDGFNNGGRGWQKSF